MNYRSIFVKISIPNMKQLIYCIFFVTTFTFGQDGFIEIEVRDSINLQPSTFDYTVKINDTNFYNYEAEEEYNPESNKQKMVDKTDELRYLLTKKGYEFKALSDSSYEIISNPYINNYGFVLNLKSKEELEKLTKDLKVLDFVQGSVSNVVYKNEVDSEARLFKKLIEKAKTKAQMIANLSEMKLGKIMEFKEVKEIDNMSYSLMDLYYMSQERLTQNSIDDDFYGKKYKTIIVKFIAQ